MVECPVLACDPLPMEPGDGTAEADTDTGTEDARAALTERIARVDDTATAGGAVPSVGTRIAAAPWLAVRALLRAAAGVVVALRPPSL